MGIDASRVVEIIFNATNNVSDVVGTISKDVNSASSSLGNIVTPLAGLANKALLTEAAIISLGLAFLSVATHEAALFNDKMEEIGSLVNATPEDIEKLKKSVQGFAVNSVSDFSSIESAVYKATSNFGSLDKAMAVLNVAEKGAQVGATSLDNAMGALSKTMNAYGLSTGDAATTGKNAEDVMAALFVTVQNGDLTMTDLSANMGKIASQAAASKVPIETVGAAIAALTGAGIGTEQTMTKLAQLFRELQNPSDELKKALGGVSLEADGLPAVLEKLKAATGGSAQKVNELFSSSEAASGAIVLINDSAGKFSGTLEAMKDKTAAFNKNVALMAGGLLDSEQKFENAGRVLLQKLGDPLEQGSADLVDSLANIFKGVSIGMDNGAFDTVYAAIKIGGKTMTDALNDIAKNLPDALELVDFDVLVAKFEKLGGSVDGLFEGIDLSTPEGLAAAIQKVVDVIAMLTEFVSGIVDSWGPAVQMMSGMIDSINELDPATIFGGGQLAGVSQQLSEVLGMLASIAGIVSDGIVPLAGLTVWASVRTSLTAWYTSLTLTTAGLTATTAATATLVAQFVIFAATAYLVKNALELNMAAYDDLKQRNEAVSDSQKNLARTAGDIKDKLATVSAQTQINIKDMADFNAKVDSGAIVFDKVSGKWESAAQMLERVSKTTGVTVKTQDELNAAIENGSITYDKATGIYSTHANKLAEVEKATKTAAFINGGFAESVDKVAQSMGLASSKGETLVSSWKDIKYAEEAALQASDEGLQAFIRYEDGVYKVISTGEKVKQVHKEVAKAVEDTSKSNVRGSSEWKNVQDAMQKATDSANDFKIKAAELNEKRYEANLTAVVDLHVADVEAQTARIQAAFESLNGGIKSTGDTLASLANSLANNLNPNNTDFLKNLINEESKRRDQEFDLQKELVTNQIDYIKAKAERLNKGDSLIKITSGDLAPELDALFEKVLKRVQIKATEEGMNLLLGLGND